MCVYIDGVGFGGNGLEVDSYCVKVCIVCVVIDGCGFFLCGSGYEIDVYCGVVVEVVWCCRVVYLCICLFRENGIEECNSGCN